MYFFEFFDNFRPFRRILFIFIIISTTTTISTTRARLDFYIGRLEMRALMGVEGELWYVENGHVDRAAVDFEMEIAGDVEELRFSWANRNSEPIPYSITYKSDPPQSTPMQFSSIASIGSIRPSAISTSINNEDDFRRLPTISNNDDNDDREETRVETFSIRLPPCSPTHHTDDYRLRIRFTFDWPSSTNRTEFELRRRKTCSRMMDADGDDGSEGSGLDDRGEVEQERSSLATTFENFLGSSTNLFYLGMGCLFGLVLITASLIILYFAKTDEGVGCCGMDRGGKTSTKIKTTMEADDAVSSLLPPRMTTTTMMNPMTASTPMNRNSAVIAFQRGCGGESAGSVSSSSGGAHRQNRNQMRRSASPSAHSKSNSALAVGTPNTNGGRPPPPRQQSHETLPRVLYFVDPPIVEFDLDAISERLLIDKSDVETGRVLLEGTFGEICIGRMRKRKPSAMEDGEHRKNGEDNDDDEEDEENWTDVLVKSVKDKSSSHQINRFLTESLRFIDLPPHPNVVSPMALVKTPDDNSDTNGGESEKERRTTATSPGRLALCYAHDGFGNLKKFLLRCRGADSSGAGGGHGPPPIVLTTQDLVYAALQIIRGLLHLHKFRLLHRDMAARNCLVGYDLSIQIYDTGLSRDLFPQDYHCLGDNENRPIKWLAIESLDRAEFSTASDVWAFGVTLWELTTLAQQPYAEVDPFEMQTYLQADQRLSQPYNCPDELYLLMYCCWNLHAEARPTFNQLLAALEHFYAQLTQYI